MLNRFVRPGDAIQRAMTARQWNEFVQAADEHALGLQSSPNQSIAGLEEPYTWALVENSDAIAERLDIRQIDTPGILPTESEGEFDIRMLFAGGSPADLGKFGVLLDTTEKGDLGKVAVSGVVACRLFVPLNADWITRADVDTSDTTRLKAMPEGSAQILWQDAGTNTEVDAIVRLGLPQEVTLPGKVDSPGATAGSTATVSIWQDVSGTMTDTSYNITGVKLDWMHNSENISSGKEVLIKWFPSESLWRFIGAECE